MDLSNERDEMLKQALHSIEFLVTSGHVSHERVQSSIRDMLLEKSKTLPPVKILYSSEGSYRLSNLFKYVYPSLQSGSPLTFSEKRVFGARVIPEFGRLMAKRFPQLFKAVVLHQLSLSTPSTPLINVGKLRAFEAVVLTQDASVFQGTQEITVSADSLLTTISFYGHLPMHGYNRQDLLDQLRIEREMEEHEHILAIHRSATFPYELEEDDVDTQLPDMDGYVPSSNEYADEVWANGYNTSRAWLLLITNQRIYSPHNLPKRFIDCDPPAFVDTAVMRKSYMLFGGIFASAGCMLSIKDVPALVMWNITNDDFDNEAEGIWW